MGSRWYPFLWGNGGEVYDRSGPVPLATFAISRGGPPPRAAARGHTVFKDFVAVTPGMRLQGEAMADSEATPNPSFHGEAEAYAELLKHYQRALKQEAPPGDALAEAAREATLVLEKMYR